MRTTPAVLIIATAVTLLALLENSVAPWAPFYLIYAATVTALPLRAGTYRFGRLRDIRVLTWILVLVSPVVLQAFVSLWSLSLYPALVSPFGVDASAAQGVYHSLGAALPELFEQAASVWGTDAATIRSIYLIFIVAWAGLGEELFYRGYMHGVLKERIGLPAAVIVSAAFFGLRHGTQLALLWPAFPWGAAFTWIFVSFVIGLFMSWLYERSGSLYPPVIAHYLFNLIPAVVAPLLAD